MLEGPDFLLGELVACVYAAAVFGALVLTGGLTAVSVCFFVLTYSITVSYAS